MTKKINNNNNNSNTKNKGIHWLIQVFSANAFPMLSATTVATTL